MTTAVTKQNAPTAAVAERALIQGDLSGLTEAERLSYYKQVCESVGLNPLTQPFAYIKLSGKLTLYAKKDCTDQLRKNNNISIRIVSREVQDGVLEVVARASTPDGREDEDVGVVTVKGLSGDSLANARMKACCVPLDSEILTRSGFKTYDRLAIGEEVLAYDCSQDVCDWVPLENISVFEDAEVSRLFTDKRQFEVICTPDHSWAVRSGEPYKPDARGDGSRGPRGPYSSRGPERKLVKANELKSTHRLILAGKTVCLGFPSLLTATEAAILGWMVTDGTLKRVGNSVRIGICQSKEQFFPAIRQLVGNVRELVSKPRDRTFPMSGKTYATKAQHWWYLPSSASKELLQKAGYTSRADLPKIVTMLDSSARRAMLEAMMMAEGDKRGNFHNTDPHIIEAFQILCALEGIATGKLKQRPSCKTLRKKKTRHVAGNFLNLEPAGRCAVWCPTTKFGTWVMRQNGWVTITGNTKAKRRVTLSICGLGFLDESEVDTIPETRAVQAQPASAKQVEHKPEGAGVPLATPPQREQIQELAHRCGLKTKEAIGDYIQKLVGLKAGEKLTAAQADAVLVSLENREKELAAKQREPGDDSGEEDIPA